jgi:hypothetical protein
MDGKTPACLQGAPPPGSLSPVPITVVASWEQNGKPLWLDLTFELRIVGGSNPPPMPPSDQDASEMILSQPSSPTQALFPAPPGPPPLSQHQSQLEGTFATQSIAPMDIMPRDASDLGLLQPTGSGGPAQAQYLSADRQDVFSLGPQPIPQNSHGHHQMMQAPSSLGLGQGQHPEMLLPYEAHSGGPPPASTVDIDVHHHVQMQQHRHQQGQQAPIDLGALQPPDLSALGSRPPHAQSSFPPEG